MPLLSTPGAPYTPGRTNFGLLPAPERSPVSFFTSFVVNGLIVLIAIYLGSQVKRLVEHKYEQTTLIFPTTPPPPVKVKMPEPPKIKMPEPPKVEVKLEQPKITMPKPLPKPEPKPIQMEAKLNMPVIKAAKPAVVLAPQPKAAMTAAMPAQNASVKPSTAPVHLGQTFGVTPNPNATRPATVAAISPIVNDAAVSGPAGALMAAQGLPVSIAGVAKAYEDFLDILIADVRDLEAAKKLDRPGLRVHCTNTIMRTADDKTKLARTVLALLNAENARAADPS